MEILAWISLVIGMLGRVFIPWLVARQGDTSLPWEWKFVWPQMLSFLLVILVVPLVIPDLDAITSLGPQAAWLVGWGAADVGRQTYKAFGND